MKKGQTVIKILSIAGHECAVIEKIARCGKNWVQCEGDDHLKYRPDTGQEIDPAPGFAGAGISSRLIALDGES